MDLYPSRKVYPTSWFILSVFLLKDGQTSVVPRCFQIPLVTQTSIPVGTSTKPAGSFSLCCFWQVVRCLWSLHVSGIPRHIDLHPGRNVYLTSWFVLSVLFLTGGETSVVPTCIRDPPSHGSPPQKKHLPDQLVCSVCVVFDRCWDVCGPYTCPYPPLHGPPPQ